MKDRLYIDHKLIEPIPPDDEVWQAVLDGKLVVAVDDAGIAIQLTPELIPPERLKPVRTGAPHAGP